MKKKTIFALLSVLMLSACAPSGTTSGGTSNIESSSTQATSETQTSQTPQMRNLTLKEAKEQARTMVENLNSKNYVEPNSYQLKASKSSTKGTEKNMLNDVFTINHSKEVMSLYEYDIPLTDTAKPFRGIHIFNKTGKDYYVTRHTSDAKEYMVVANTTFDDTITSANFHDLVGFGIIKESTVDLLNNIVNADFTGIDTEALTLTMKGDGQGKLEFFYTLNDVDDKNNKRTTKENYAFEEGKIASVYVSTSITNSKNETLKRAAIRYMYDYKEWNIETPEIDNTWTEIK